MMETSNQRNKRISPTACHRCRQQKRKCSRDFPACRRCRGQRIDCGYPEPPNRKLLAEERLKRLAEKKQTYSSNAFSQPDKKLRLLQFYFSHFISSEVLFDEEDLLSKNSNGTIPNYLLQSLLALSSIIAPRANVDLSLDSCTSNNYIPVNDCENYYSFQHDLWVLQTSRSPLLSEPSLSVEAVLASFHQFLYWYALGEVARARSIADFTYRSSLELTRRSWANAIELSPQSALSTFAVYWFARCFVQEPRSVDSRLVLELPNNPTLSGTREIVQSIQAGHVPPLNSGCERICISSKLLGYMGCWFRVREFVVALRTVEDPVSMISSLTKLDIHTTAVYESFNVDKVEQAFLGISTSAWHYKFLVCEVLYYQCRAVPHLQMFLSTMRLNASKHEFFQLSATIAVRHILSLTEAINRLLQITSPERLSSIPPFLGYPSFLAASLQLGSLMLLGNINTEIFPDDKSRLLNALQSCLMTNLLLLNSLQRLWVPIGIMWKKLLPLISCVSISMEDINAFGNGSRSTPIIDQTATTELLTLVSEHLSQILSIVDITEPFYLPLETYVPTPGSYQDESPSNAPQSEIAASQPTRADVTSKVNQNHQELPETHDYLEHLLFNFFDKFIS